MASSSPLISVVITAGDDNQALDLSLRSCLARSLAAIEVICVRSVGAAPSISEDPRVVHLSQPAGATDAQMRKIGAEAATARYVLFLCAGDLLSPGAMTLLLRRAEETHAQLIGFGVEFESAHGSSLKVYPPPGPLRDSDILRHLVPREATADLAVWRALFDKKLLVRAYADYLADAETLVDDRAIVLLAYATATAYESVKTVVYRRGATFGATYADPAQLARALDRVRSFRSIKRRIRELASESVDPEPLLDGYTAGHLTAIADALRLFAALPEDLRLQEHAALREGIDDLDAISAAVAFAPETIPVLVKHAQRIELGDAPVRSALLTTNVLTTGGVSGVLLTQARFLLEAGYGVTIVTHRPGSAESLVPEGASLVQLTGTTRRQRVMQWAQLCRNHGVDVVLDHRILYSRDWPAFALAARAAGAATIGWIHNFAGRPTYNGNDLQTFMQTHLGALAHLIVLSPLDVVFWKLRGISHVSYLPNPPSPLLLDAGGASAPKRAPKGRPLELVWWGRLEEHTKKVSQLVEMAAALQRLGVDFRLRIVGPDWADMSAGRLLELATTRGVAGRVDPIGPQHGEDLLGVIDSSDVFVNTSIIEGYPLTLPEAQSRALPVVMYELPWLPLIQHNAGVITTPQQDPDALAIAIADLAADPARYEAMSRASVESAARATSHDFARLYVLLLSGELSPEHSPEPTVEDGRRLVELLVFFAEHSTPPPRTTRTSSVANAKLRRKSRPWGDRIERKLTPIGNQVVDAAPWLRPAANKVKRMLLRR